MAVMSERLAQEAEVLGLSGMVGSVTGASAGCWRSGIGDFVSKPESEAALSGIEHVGWIAHAMPIRLIRDLSQQKPD